MSAVIDIAAQLPEDTEPRVLCSLLHSLANAPCSTSDSAALLDALLPKLLASLSDLAPRELLEALHACAALFCPSKALLEGAAAALEASAADLTGWELATALWVYTSANGDRYEPPASLIETLAAEVARRPEELSPYGLAGAARDLVVSGVRCDAAFDAICREASVKSREFSAQSLATLSRSLVVAGCYRPDLFTQLAGAIELRAHELTPHGCGCVFALP